MGKGWDSDKGGRDQWVAWMTEVMQECMRVLKPGAHGLVWALPRTSHWTATALENAGFEIRDVVNHIFGSGFPKSLDVSKAIDKATGNKIQTNYIPQESNEVFGNGKGKAAGVDRTPGAKLSDFPVSSEAKQWEGFGTALKPAHEHWILIRKPLGEKTVAANVLKHGTGALNIDASRIQFKSDKDFKSATFGTQPKTTGMGTFQAYEKGINAKNVEANIQGRFPANLVLSEDAAKGLDEHSGHLHAAGNKKESPITAGKSVFGIGDKGKRNPEIPGDKGGGASRFFYVAKASKSDKGADNTHPTVKSTKLMEYLIKLITPPGGKILDPFMGSGSTGVAAVKLGHDFIGFEQNAEYLAIAEARLNACLNDLTEVIDNQETYKKPS